jgi:hypothetical protein
MSRNVAPRAGRRSAADRQPATFGLLALVVPSVALASTAGTTMPTRAESTSGESAKAQRILTAGGFDTSTGKAALGQPWSRSRRPGPVAAGRRRVDGGRAGLAPNLLSRVDETSELSMDDHVFILNRIKETA